MPEHHGRIEIARPAAEVYESIANPMNLPRWQPRLRESVREGPDQIRVVGGGTGAAGFAEHVRFSADPAARCISWATPTGVGCAGDLRVEGDGGASTVVLTLRLSARAGQPEAVADWTGDPGLGLEGAIQASLVALKRLCEGGAQGVGLVSGGTQAQPGQAPLRDSRPYGSSATQNPGTS